jgi:hypothetical protein
MNRNLKALLLKFQVFRDLRDGRSLRAEKESGRYAMVLDYPFSSVPRYGHGKPAHRQLSEIFGRHRSDYLRRLIAFLPFKPSLEEISVQRPDDPKAPYWLNQFFGGLDPVSLYVFACLNNPRKYIEIGSGNSTKFMRRAVERHRLRTRIISIDPSPRAEIDEICDEVRREPLEGSELGIFERLEPGDIVFMDASHRVFMNSDTSVFFLDVLPRLPSGVLVYIDDIYLPFDYPPEWVPRYYSEQYLLAVLLLAEPKRYEIVLPSTFVGRDPGLMEAVSPLWSDGPLAGASGPGSGFWLSIR